MNPIKMLSVVLILAGGLALAYGGFTYTHSKPEVKLGPVELSVKQTETVNIPVWAGAGAMAIGVLLFVRK